MKINVYTQLMLLVGMLLPVMPLAAHQLDHDAHTSSGAFWHNIMHTFGECVTQFSASYLLVLIGLLSILAFVAFKVKSVERSGSH